MITICAWCGRARGTPDSDDWECVSHGMCPECAERGIPDEEADPEVLFVLRSPNGKERTISTDTYHAPISNWEVQCWIDKAAAEVREELKGQEPEAYASLRITSGNRLVYVSGGIYANGRRWLQCEVCKVLASGSFPSEET